MSITQRLSTLVLAAVIGLFIMAGVSYRQLERVYEAANFNSVNVVPSLVLLDKGSTDMGRYRVRVYRHVIASDPKKMAIAESEIKEIVSSLEQGFKDYEALLYDAEDKRLLEATRNALHEYSRQVEPVLQLSRNHQQKEAIEGLDALAQPAGVMLAAFTAHMKYNETLGKTASAAAAEAKSHANLIAVGVTLTTLTILCLLGLSIIRSLTSRIETANQMAARVAAGDLSPAPGMDRSNDEIGRLLQSLDKMRGDLSTTIREVVGQAETVGNSATQLSAISLQVANSSQSQSQSTASAAAAVEQLTVSIDHVGQSADDARQQAGDAEQKALSSGRDVDTASGQIVDVAQRIEQTAAQIHALSEHVQKIGNVTTVIRDVADQTNLLALNAAIEAARAGEQGRGFAVVADEVRKLAERTTQSVQEIASMITAIQGDAITAVDSMQSSKLVVSNVVTSAERATHSMHEIRASAETMQYAITGISDALREQRSASVDLSRNVETIARMSEENSAAISTVSETANQLENVSGQLKNSVARFRF